MNSSPDVLVLIVTHNGENTIKEAVQALPRALKGINSKVLFVDNSSQDQTLAILRDESDSSQEIIASEINMGVGAAYNLGLEKALENDIRWMLILDQDSVCREGCLDVLVHKARELEKPGKQAGAVCSTPRSRKYPQVIHYPYLWKNNEFCPADSQEDEKSVIPVDSSISSGTLYNTRALKSINGFRQDYFIDFVDHECHLRLKQAGWQMWWAVDAVLFHNLGKSQWMIEGSLWIEHQPFRYYYMARNMTEGYFRLGGLRAVLRFWRQAWNHMNLARKRNSAPGKCVKFFIKGILHALQRKSGPLASDG